MMKINFQPVFDYIDMTFDLKLDLKLKEFKEDLLSEVRAELREMKSQIANLTTKVETTNREMIVANHRVRRLEGWAEPVGRKINIPFQY